MAKNSIRTKPIQKVGRAKVVREPVTAALSSTEPRLEAAAIPRTMPMMIEISVEAPIRSRVFCSLPDCTICWLMGWPFWYDIPNWKVSIE